MLGHINQLVSGFEKEHGVLPNLLYINHTHSEYLKSSFDERFSLDRIVKILCMDVIIESDIIHPHVAWTHFARQQIAS